MKTRISTTLEAGDMVHHHKRLWLVETMQAGRPCSVQCAMYDAEADKCCGYCFRWANGDDKVFRYLLPDTAVKDATEVVQTPDLLKERLTNTDDNVYNKKNEHYYGKIKPMREAREKRGYGMGIIYKSPTGWTGEIYVEGNTLRITKDDKSEVERWLDAMVAKKQAMKELERMKKK